ncbi:hypothetical protein GTO91_03010 [Heliobacterium undosum]|uniref:DUF3168 domain-containing protein n=1 Tax=Heliomicrobium undosum TaxID=121734 RepID=A0A845L4K2_9FIRM|nr:minor capsid protein [Heliomicrobium undosum]MZP28688.1 hypothetical protein [Heliomicrobium undosum]
MSITELIAVLKQTAPFTYFANTFPPLAGDCAAVQLTGGGEASLKANISRPALQILIRASDPAVAEKKATDLHQALHGKRNFDVGTTHVIFCAAAQSGPLFLGLDENNRSVYSLNFTLITEEA